MILHDWSDGERVQILDPVRENAPDGARLFVVEHVVPGPDELHFSKLFDLHRMCVTTGGSAPSTSTTSSSARAGGTSWTRTPPRGSLVQTVEAEAA